MASDRLNNLIRVGALFCTSCLLSIKSVSADTAGTNSILDKFITDISFSNGDAFVRLCAMEKIPCGVEEMRCDDFKSDTPAQIYLSSTTLRKAFNYAANLRNGYKWIIRGGVANLEPIRRAGDDLLSRPIAQVSIKNISSSRAAFVVLNQAGITVPMRTLNGPPPLFAKINLELKNTTVRDALNSIAKADGAFFWILSPNNAPSTACFVTGTWRTGLGKTIDR